MKRETYPGWAIGTAVGLVVLSAAFVRHTPAPRAGGKLSGLAAAVATRQPGGARPSPDQSAGRTFRQRLLDEYDLSDPQIDLDGLFAPGVWRDGIPALTRPPKTAAASAAYPSPDARVVEVVVGDEAVAYPLGILAWHEIVNDEVGGRPVAITYCPLCDSVAVVDRRLTTADGTVTLEFGVSGLLYNSNVVMYDRATRGLWSQVYMRAVSGPHAGRALDHLPVRVVSFETFRQRHPDGRVLTTETGHRRDYERDPYRDRGYYDNDLIFHEFEFDDRLPPKELGLGVLVGTSAYFVVAREALEHPVSLETAQGRVTVAANGLGVELLEAPAGTRAVQTFYHSWSAFFPDTAIEPADAARPPQKDK